MHHGIDRLIEDDENISVTRTNSTCRSRSSSRSRSGSPRDEGCALNLDTKSTRVLVEVDHTPYEEISPKAKATDQLKSRLEEAYQSCVDQQSSKRYKKFSPAEDIEARSSAHKAHDTNGNENGLESFRSAKPKKALHKEDSVIDCYGSKDKIPTFLPRNYIEHLDLIKNTLPIHKYSSLDTSNFPLPLPLLRPTADTVGRPMYPTEFLPYLHPPYHSTGSEPTVPLFTNHHFVGYPHPLLFSVSDDAYRKEPPKVPSPVSPSRTSPPKVAQQHYQSRAESGLSTQSSVAPIH